MRVRVRFAWCMGVAFVRHGGRQLRVSSSARPRHSGLLRACLYMFRSRGADPSGPSPRRTTVPLRSCLQNTSLTATKSLLIPDSHSVQSLPLFKTLESQTFEFTTATYYALLHRYSSDAAKYSAYHGGPPGPGHRFTDQFPGSSKVGHTVSATFTQLRSEDLMPSIHSISSKM